MMHKETLMSDARRYGNPKPNSDTIDDDNYYYYYIFMSGTHSLLLLHELSVR